jgi:predicted nucleic acid-binding Zn ribbon protein
MSCRFCDRPAKSNRLCATHYSVWFRAGKPDLDSWDGKPASRPCSECGQDFRPEPWQTLCSDACRLKQADDDREKARARQRSYYAANPQKQIAKTHARYKQISEQLGRVPRPCPADGMYACQRCGKPFPGTPKQFRFCSAECRAGKTAFKCAWCGSGSQGGKGQKFCSAECRRADEKIRPPSSRRGRLTP